MLENHLFENIPHYRFLVFHHLLGSLRCRRKLTLNELIEDERLEEFKRHQLRHTTLMQAQFRTNCNHRTTGVVDTLTEQILTEAATLALDHVGQRLERTLVGASHRLAATAVVEKRIHSFLQHTLFIADDDIGSLDLKETLQTVVAIDDSTIKIIQI